MHILLIGLNYKTAPVEMREKVAFAPDSLPQALERLRNTKSVLECVILGTCNRTELYAVVDQLHTGRYFMKKFLVEWFGIDHRELEGHLYVKEDDQTVRHLFRVTCGLDSMVLGETQILGQVRDAFFLAQENKTTGTIFNTLFKQAITLAKKAHSETEIGQNAVSVSYAAIELGKKIFGSFAQKSVLVLGAGKMSELTAKHLHANGASRVVVVNRTLERAAELAAKFRGTACPMERLEEALTEADIVVSSTGAQDYVVTKAQIEQVMKRRRHRPLFMIDIAVPRDLDPAINELDNVYLYDIDDLEGIVEANLQERQKEAEKVHAMIDEELVAFQAWLNTLGVVPLISSLRDKALAVQAETMRSIENKLPHLSERERKILDKHTKSIVNQLLRDPILRIKEMAAEPEAELYLEAFKRIFALDETVGGEATRESKVTKKERKESYAKESRILASREAPVRS
ncbi:glutamyl-tRNA reductase [Bacillaceae bacterium]